MKFNKFHGLFCGTRNIVHRYHMAGRVPEESNKSFNSVMASPKNMLQIMYSTVDKIELLNYRAQGNLKAEIIEEKMKILKKRDQEEYTQSGSVWMRVQGLSHQWYVMLITKK